MAQHGVEAPAVDRLFGVFTVGLQEGDASLGLRREPLQPPRALSSIAGDGSSSVTS